MRRRPVLLLACCLALSACSASVPASEEGSPHPASPHSAGASADSEASSKSPSVTASNGSENDSSRGKPTGPAEQPTPSPEPSTPQPSVPPAPAEQVPPSVDCTVARCIALTFDDGPGAYTEKLLDTLRNKGVHATFFVVGSSVATNPSVVAREVAEGHAVGNHSWSHPVLSRLDTGELRAQISRTNDAIVAAGAPRPILMRPPYGATSDAVQSELAFQAMAAVMWNVDTEDWKNRSVSVTTQRAMAGAFPGAIILMHDVHPSTVRAVPGIIDQLQAQGFTLVTVPQLMGGNMQPFIGKKVFGQNNVR